MTEAAKDNSIEVFICYAHEDESMMKELATHLGALQRQGLFDVWHNREIGAGTEWAQEIDKHLNTAQIILLLISQYFLNSDYCYLVEMERALERHERGDARVIPIILHPVYYAKAPFAKLQPLPTNGKPAIGPDWYNLNWALFDVVEGIRKAAEEIARTLR
jgi:hypothetical protein